MMLNVNNVGNDFRIENNGDILSANAIDVTIGNTTLELPTVLPNSKEIEYSKISKTKLGILPFQFVAQVRNIREIRNVVKQKEIITKYDSLLKTYHTVGDFTLQFPQDNKLQNVDRHIIHKIQNNTNSVFLNDIELDREQSVADLESQIIQLRNDNPNRIVCPTLDIGMKSEGLFDDKLEFLIPKFKKINIVYRSINDNRVNWLDLVLRLRGKSVWCNLVGVLPRWRISDKASNLVRVFDYGVHSASLAYAWSGAPNMASYVLDLKTLCYKEVKNMTYPESRITSLLQHKSYLSTARQQIIKGTYFTK